MGSDFTLLLMDKKEGVTSFSSLYPIKKENKGKKVGHAGTLDKFASGLMVVFIGSATRLNPVFSSFGKKYIGKLKFGVETDTLDPEGNVVGESTNIPSKEEIDEILPSFLGRQLQVPPLYSALHVDGKRAYQIARKGEEVDMEPREIEIYSLRALSYESGILEFEASVSKGTYIRSLARDIALKLNSRGHLIALRRTEVGPFTLSDIGKDTFTLLDKTNLFSTVVMDGKKRKLIHNGSGLDSSILSDSDKEKPYCFVRIDDELYGIGEKNHKLKFLTRFQ